VEYFRELPRAWKRNLPSELRWLTVHPQEINVLGVHNTVASWINSQPDPKKPIGTVININSGMAGFIVPGHSAYSVSKLTAHRYMEYVAAGALAPIRLSNTRNMNGPANIIPLIEYPTLRPFTLLPGIVPTEMNVDNDQFLPYAKDEGEQTGALGLYLASSRADYLVNSLTSINWDLAEMEAHKEKIEGGLLRNKWVPVLPVGGGEGL
jgi:NAD(P)-dependent dehydrogenase (short-subunit alcohol dehydrogenase family)